MSTFQYKYNELQRKWLDDLKTTTEPQTTNYLHRTGNGVGAYGFCCLGRACVVAEWPVFEANGCQGMVEYGTEEDFNGENLPTSLSLKLKLYGTGGGNLRKALPGVATSYGVSISTLTMLNDDLKWSFKQIAEYIEANPDNVFSDYEEQKKEWERINATINTPGMDSQSQPESVFI